MVAHTHYYSWGLMGVAGRFRFRVIWDGTSPGYNSSVEG
jgi:hypothetical protein